MKKKKTRFACFRDERPKHEANNGMGHAEVQQNRTSKRHFANNRCTNKQRIFSIIIANCYIIQIYGRSEGWLQAQINNFLIVHKSFKWNQGQRARPLRDKLGVGYGGGLKLRTGSGKVVNDSVSGVGEMGGEEDESGKGRGKGRVEEEREIRKERVGEEEGGLRGE